MYYKNNQSTSEAQSNCRYLITCFHTMWGSGVFHQQWRPQRLVSLIPTCETIVCFLWRCPTLRMWLIISIFSGLMCWNKTKQNKTDFLEKKSRYGSYLIKSWLKKEVWWNSHLSLSQRHRPSHTVPWNLSPPLWNSLKHPQGTQEESLSEWCWSPYRPDSRPTREGFSILTCNCNGL